MHVSKTLGWHLISCLVIVKLSSEHPNLCNEAQQLAACVVEYIAVYQYVAYVKFPNWHLCSLHPICLYIPLRQCLTGIPVVIYIMLLI